MLGKIEGIALKIDNSVKSVSQIKASQAASKRSHGAGAQGRVDTSPLSSRLHALESSLEKVQVVDSARVKAIKQAISEGRFRVNSDVVADRLLTAVKELVLNHKD